MATFNLVDEPWIPVVSLGGRAEMVSLKDLFARAHELRAVEADNPLATVAIYRVLLAILHRSLDGPRMLREWGGLWKRGKFDGTGVDTYLSKWRDRFDLFSTEHPFYQTSGFTVKEASPAAKLLADASTGNNRTLFAHDLDAEPLALPPAVAVRALIATQAYALGGGKGVTSDQFGEHPYLSHGPLVQGVIAMLMGETLFETLCLNALEFDDRRPIPRTENDMPVWEQEKEREFRERKFGVHPPYGYLDYLTWKSRHIRLLPETTETGTVVRFMHVGQALAVESGVVRDPAQSYRQGKDAERRPVFLSPDRALWRDSDAIFEMHEGKDQLGRPLAFQLAADAAGRGYLPRGKRLNVSLFGLANEKANPLMWRHESVPASLSLFEDKYVVARLRRAVEVSSGIAECLRLSARRLAASALPGGADKDAVTRFVSAAGTMDRYWSALDAEFSTFIDNLSDDSEAALKKWEAVVKRAAKSALRESADNCLGRTARELKARVEAEALFDSLIFKLKLADEA